MKKMSTFSESCLQEFVFSSTSDAKVEASSNTNVNIQTLPVQDPNNVVGWQAEEQVSENESMMQQTIIDLTLEVFRKYPLIKRIL